MISFSPSTIKDSLISAINKLDFLEGNIAGIEFNEFSGFTDNEHDFTIDEESPVSLYIGEDDSPKITASQFIAMSEIKDQLKINDAQSYAKSNHEVYFLLAISDYNTQQLLDNTFRGVNIFAKNDEFPVSILEKETVIDGKVYHSSLFNGFCIFHLLVEESGNFDKYDPSYSTYDYFVKISCEDQNIDMGIADILASAYVFELQTSLNILLPFSSGRIDSVIDDRSDETLFGLETKLFPLVYGVGVANLLNLYNTAKNTSDLDFKILGFTKIIEYIAPTITQKELIESVSLKLTSPNVFKPTAAFISELGAIYDKHRNTINKDSELIKLSILTAVTLPEIWDVIPDFIKGKQAELPDELEYNIWLGKLSECVYSTRNEIAHAKANYEKHGTECPQKYKNDFCAMLDTVAVRCIRWFALQPEEKRVVMN